MRDGKQRRQRELVVSQAVLVWAQLDNDQIAEFIETGFLNPEGDDGEIIPFNPELRSLIVEQWEKV